MESERRRMPWDYVLDHPKVAGFVSFLAFAATFSPRASVVASWICLAVAWLFAIAAINGWPQVRNAARPRLYLALSSSAVLVLLVLYGFWLCPSLPGSAPPAQPPPLPLKEVRIAHQRLVSSTLEGSLYAKEVTLHTTVDIHPTWLALACNAEIVQAECWVNQGTTSCNFSGCGSLLSKDKKTIWIHFQEPTFSPQTPLIVTLIAKTNIIAESVREERPPVDAEVVRDNAICIRRRLVIPIGEQ